jgi:hypothetical protein
MAEQEARADHHVGSWAPTCDSPVRDNTNCVS